jgi:hypothetical protein
MTNNVPDINSYYATTAYRGNHSNTTLGDLPVKRPKQFKQLKPIKLNPQINGNDYIASSNDFEVNSTESIADLDKKANKYMKVSKYSEGCYKREKHSYEHEYLAPSGFNVFAKFYFLAMFFYVAFFLVYLLFLWFQF